MAKVLALINVLMLPKDYNEQIIPYLHSSEIACKCKRVTCHYTLLAGSTLHSFGLSREQMGLPLSINSAYRCQAHNADVGGVEHSSHTTGFAMDIRKYYEHRLNERLKKVLESNFDVVIEYGDFFHCHNHATNKVSKSV